MKSAANRCFRKLAAHDLNGGPKALCYTFLFDSYGHYYWSGRTREFTFEEWQAAVKLSERYHRYWNYCTEVAPEWTDTGEWVMFTDGVTRLEQRAKDGRTRWIYGDRWATGGRLLADA